MVNHISASNTASILGLFIDDKAFYEDAFRTLADNRRTAEKNAKDKGRPMKYTKLMEQYSIENASIADAHLQNTITLIEPCATYPSPKKEVKEMKANWKASLSHGVGVSLSQYSLLPHGNKLRLSSQEHGMSITNRG